MRFLDGDAEKLVGFLVGSLGEGPTQVPMSRPGIEPGACGLKVRMLGGTIGAVGVRTSTNHVGLVPVGTPGVSQTIQEAFSAASFATPARCAAPSTMA